MRNQTCEWCGQSYTVCPSRNGRNRYCSRQCAYQALTKPRGDCKECGGPIKPTPSNHDAKFCSRICANRSTSKRRKTTKYRQKTSKGYVIVRMPSHPCASKGGYVMEHRLVVEANIGRHLSKDEVVHHINGKKDDNRIENLELMTKEQHDALPKPRRPITCPKCGHCIARSRYAWDAEELE